MKNISIKILIVCCLAFFVSCEKDFEDLNKNPFATTITSVGPLFNNVVSSLRLGWNEQFYVHNEVLYKQTQLAALTSEAWSNLSIGTEDIWSNYYITLAHIRDIEKRLDEMENPNHPDSLNNVRGMVKILKAYKTFRVTDLFGDMPFFEAGRGYEGVEFLHPKYDSQEDIYKYLLEDLKWAAENISLAPQSSTGGTFYSIAYYDKLFDGQLLMWIKFANSLRLRHAMRIAEKEPELAASVITEIIDNSLPVIGPGEDVVMLPSKQNWLRESTNWSFREHKHLRMGSNIWNQMADNDSTNGTGFYDPRAFLFFESNNDNKWVAYPQIPDANTPPSGGVPYGMHRDLNYTIKGEDCIYSPFNYYLIRDENDIPEIILTGSEYYFIKSEACFRGIGLPQDPNLGSAEYFEGVIVSMDFWDNLKNNSSIWINTDPNYENTNPYDVANKIFFIEDPEEKLELLYAQRWIDAFRQPWEAYSLARRTEKTPREGDPLNYFRLPYPPSESEHNTVNWSAQSAKMGGDLTTIKVWWME
jgi:hypothetical protein